MIASIKGHYNGSSIVVDEGCEMDAGQRVLIVFEMPVKKNRKQLDLSKYRGRGEKMPIADAQEYVKELRDGDRF